MLLEGPPGTAKTFLAQCFAAALGLDFGRIQFTPDLMPGDILGSNLFNFQTSQFTLTRGPIFCELLLADEINRTPPKTQAALLEAMQERRVTLDGDRPRAARAFMVVATQNPIESQGVYPLPEAQLDRFLFKLLVPYPSAEEEAAIVARYRRAAAAPPRPAEFGIARWPMPPRSAAASAAVAAVTLAERDRRLHRRGWCARRARAPTCRAAPRRAPRCCWPAPPAPAPRSTGATMWCPTTSRRSPRGAAPPPAAQPRGRDRGARRSRRWSAGLVEQTEAPR